MKVTRHHQHPQAGTQLYTKGLNGHVSSPMLPPSNSLLPYFFFQTEMLIMSLFNMFRMKPKFFSVVCKTLQDMLLVRFSGLISFPHLEQSTSGSPFPSWPVPSGTSELPHEPILSQGTCSLHLLHLEIASYPFSLPGTSYVTSSWKSSLMSSPHHPPSGWILLLCKYLYIALIKNILTIYFPP